MPAQRKTKKEEDVIETTDAKKGEGADVEEETVTVKKKDLDNVFSQLDRQSKEISMLMDTADKARLAKAKAQHNPSSQLIHKARVWRFGPDRKIVVGTKMVSNQAEIINGRYIEDQRIAVVFEDGKTEEVQLLNFHRNVDRGEKGDIISREEQTNKDGSRETLLTIELEDGQRVKISSQYIN